jgi:hypothetical protein
MNPKGARRPAYSCEENCPTGALVRVDPRQYFGEVKDALGLVYRDQTHAVGRNIPGSDPVGRLYHILGMLMMVALTGAAAWAVVRYGYSRPLGGTGLNLHWLTGLGGLIGIVCATAYQARKKIYRRRFGALRYWMQWHVYFGMTASAILFIHSMNGLGGLLTTSLTISYGLVLASGLFGIICYLVVPRIMTSVEENPLLIEDLLARRDELRASFKAVGAQADARLRLLIEERVRNRFLSFSYLISQYLRRRELTVLLAEAREEFREEAARLESTEMSRLLIEAVETAATLRRVDSLIYLHRMLKLWLAPHIVSTALMLALMFTHIIQVVFFNRS